MTILRRGLELKMNSFNLIVKQKFISNKWWHFILWTVDEKIIIFDKVDVNVLLTTHEEYCFYEHFKAFLGFIEGNNLFANNSWNSQNPIKAKWSIVQ